MSLLASPLDGLAMLGWRRVMVTALAFCLAPALVGGVVLAASTLFGLALFDTTTAQTQGLAMFALVTPLFTAPIWAMIALATMGLLRIGRLGWLPAALIGVLTFGALMQTGIGSISLPFGAASALAYRMALALQKPEAI